MALRPVIDIDVRDAALDQTLQKLARLQQATRGVQLPIVAPGAAVSGGTAAQQRQQNQLVQTLQRVGLSTQMAERSAAAMARSWGVIRDHADRVSRYVSDMVRQLTSFTGMMGLATGAATLGGMFGMDVLGRMSSGLRMQSMALSPGADVGMMQAFGVANRRLGVGPGTLQAVSNMMQSPATRGVLTGIMGANVREEMDPTEATLETLRALRERARGFRAQGMPLESIMQATQAGQIGLDQPALMRLMNMREQEFTQQQQLTRGRAGSLNITDAQLKRWQDFLDTIDTAKGRIEKTFITGLGDLAEPVGRLTNALTDMLQAMLEGPRIRGWIEGLRQAIEGATEWFKNPENKQRVDDFFAAIGNVVQHLMNFASALSGLVDWIATHFKGIAIAGGALAGAKAGGIAGAGVGAFFGPGGAAIGGAVGALGGAVAGGMGANYLMSPAEGTRAPAAPVQPSAYYQQRYNELYRVATLRNLPNPEVIAQLGAAQSSLETGYGAHVPGRNYFGIKARPGEAAVNLPTTEVVNGQTIQTMAAFKAEAGPQDYLELLARRYPGALAAGNINDAIRAVTQGGYATDPDYAGKLQGILRGQGAMQTETNTRQQISAIGRSWRDQNRQLATEAQARPVSTLASNLPGDGSGSARFGNVLITMRNEAGGNAFVSAGAMAV